MFRCIRILGNNFISRSLPQQSYLFIHWNSTVAQANEFVTKGDTNVEDLYLKKKKDFEDSFANITDVSSLLKNATSKRKIDFAFKALDLLADWCNTRNIKFEEVEKDENYENLVSVVEKQANGRPVEEIIRALKNLKRMGVSNTNFLVEDLTTVLALILTKRYQLCVLPFCQSLENDLLWNVRKVSVYSLLTILAFQLQHAETARQKKVIEQAIFSIERRWTEVRNAREFCFIYSLANSFSPSFHGHIDDLILENSENMKVYDLARIFVAISYSKRRPTPVLRNLAYHMFKINDLLPPQQICNILYAMNSLSFPDETLLGKLSSDFLAQVENIKESAIIGAVAFNMGQLKWKEKDLIDALVKWVVKNIDNCRCNDIISLIITLATVYHIPDNVDEFFRICTPKLELSLISEKNIWIDIVWALVIMGKATPEQIATVLEPSFILQFPIDDPSCVGSYLKLMNISSAAEVLEENYNGPKLQFSNFDNLLITLSRKDIAFHSHIQKILHNFLPPPKYLRETVRTKYGFLIDALLIVDKNCKPLDMSDFSSQLVVEKETTSKPLPTGAHKVALMVWNYKDYTIGSSSLTGQNVLAVRLLKKLGYKVVEIPYYDINKKEKTIRSVQYFEKKIRETITK